MKKALLLIGMAAPLHAQIVEPTSAPVSGNTTNPTNIVYFAAAGSDSNDCKSHGVDVNGNPTNITPCLTQTKAESLLSAGGVTVLFNGGDEFRFDKFGQHNRVNSTNTTTYATNPVLGQNVTIGSYGTGQAIFEGADEIQSLTWTSVDGTTWVAGYTGTLIAESLYIDKKHVDSAGTGSLLRAPNGPSTVWASGTYQPGSLVSIGSNYYVASNIGPTTTPPNVNLEAWRQGINSAFSTTATGIANVQAVPGSYFNDTVNGNIYVHLADGSSPATHVVQASNRAQGIQCESCNGWLVKNVMVEKYYYNAITFTTYSMANSTNGYYTTVNDQIDGVNVWDNTSEIRWLYTGQSGATRNWKLFQLGIAQNSLSSAAADEASTGWKITNSFVGRSGNPGGVGGDGSIGSIYVNNGTAPEVANNTVIPWTANGISVQNGSRAYVHDNTAPGQLRGCAYCVSNNHGLFLMRNTAKNGAGDAVQWGGATTGGELSTWDNSGHPELDVPGPYPVILKGNAITDYGLVGTNLYNGFDGNTNSAVKGSLVDGNTVVNPDSACFTFEVVNGSPAGAGITDVTFRNNICSMHKIYAPYTDRSGVAGQMNNSQLIYFANSTAPNLNGFFHSSNNLLQIGSNNSSVAKVGTCAQFLTLVNDKTSKCLPNTSDPIFTNITTGVYTLKAFSPAINQPLAGQKIGAMGLDYTPIVGGRFSGAVSGSGTVKKQ